MHTPALIYNADELLRKVQASQQWAQDLGVKLLYAIKAQSWGDVLEIFSPYLDGFAVSSEFEVRWAKEYLRPGQIIHLSSPWAELPPDFKDLPLQVSLNSLGQWPRWSRKGLRIHPQIQLAQDERYNPASTHSHLGVHLSELESLVMRADPRLSELEGISLHAFCELADFRFLALVCDRIRDSLSPLLPWLKWINLGGGMLLEEGQYQQDFRLSLQRLRQVFAGDIYLEPGHDLVEGAFCLKTKVVDIIGEYAVLDTTVNHLPEVPQFQDRPILKEEIQHGQHAYQLCGRSCLVSDRFGRYCFESPLSIGQELTFLYTGSYSLVKANRFNGINLPSIYRYRESEGLVLQKSFSYEDFRSFYCCQ